MTVSFCWSGHTGRSMCKNLSFVCSSLLLQQYPACLTSLFCIVCLIVSKWPYNCYFLGNCFQNRFKISSDFQRVPSSILSTNSLTTMTQTSTFTTTPLNSILEAICADVYASSDVCEIKIIMFFEKFTQYEHFIESCGEIFIIIICLFLCYFFSFGCVCFFVWFYYVLFLFCFLGFFYCFLFLVFCSTLQ